VRKGSAFRWESGIRGARQWKTLSRVFAKGEEIKMNRAFFWGCALALLLCATLPAHASGILLNFGGLKDKEAVDNLYNGGTGGDGSTRGYNFGITFSSNTLALTSFLQGGSGNFSNPPLGTPAIFFGSSSGIMNSTGFTTGVQFYYAAGRQLL
jgi:hypothetical protein